MTKTVHIESDVAGTLGSPDGPVPFRIPAGEHDAAELDPAVLAYLLEFGLATVVKKKGES